MRGTRSAPALSAPALRIGSLDMLARRLSSIVRFGPLAVVALQLVLLLGGDPSTAASGGGDFPYRLK